MSTVADWLSPAETASVFALSAVPVAWNVTGLPPRVPEVAVSVFAPAVVPSVHEATVARPLALIVATFFRFVARRIDTRPEDYEGAEISDGAGELGFFSPHSWWPILIALSGSVTAVGIALWLPWLITAGVMFILASVAGLVFEYYVGPEKH